MNAVELLESQHREVEALFKQIESLGDKAGREKKQIFAEIAHKMDIHAKLEEKIFYPAGEEVDEDMTLEAFEEHDVVKALIRKISRTSPSDETFLAKVTVLKEMIQHHVEEEEQEYFPKCEKTLGEVKMAALGEELEKKMMQLESKSAKPKSRRVKKAA